MFHGVDARVKSLSPRLRTVSQDIPDSLRHMTLTHTAAVAVLLAAMLPAGASGQGSTPPLTMQVDVQVTATRFGEPVEAGRVTLSIAGSNLGNRRDAVQLSELGEGQFYPMAARRVDAVLTWQYT